MNDRHETIRELLNQHRQQRDSGTITDEDLVQAHPELMPEIQDELRKLRIIDQAREQAKHQDVSTDGGLRDQLSTETFCDNSSDLSVDASVPDYDLLRRIGKGGFGEVWLGRHRLHGEYVAVKLVPKQRLVELEGVRSYKQQAKQHSNLVPIEHVGETDTCYYYVMPLADDVKGAAALRSPDHYEPKTLQWCLDNLPPMSPEQVYELAQQLLDAITDLHDVGLMHADVKPANVMQLADRWKLGDLGLMTRSEQQSMGRGTVAFWPPEGTTGPTADLYALGKTLYLAITHQSLQSFDAFVAGTLPVLGNPTVINHLRKIIHRACHPELDQRIQTAREFGELLNATPEPITPEPVTSDPVTPESSPVPAPGTDPTTSRWKKPAVLAAGCLLAIWLVYGIMQSRPGKAPDDTVDAVPLSGWPLENLLVEHLPAVDKNDGVPLGAIGVSSFWAKPAEQLGIQVSLEKPARFFVVQLKSPGDMHLVYPPSETENTVVPPAQSRLELQLHINEPPADPRTPYCLGVMLVILNEPLTFSEWTTTLGQSGFPNWPPVRSKHCWFYQDGQPLFEARSRGTGIAENAILQPPEELAHFCRAVQENKGTAQVQLVTFPVLSTHVGSR